MKPLYLLQAWIKQEYKQYTGFEIIKGGNEVAFFITRDTPITLIPYETSPTFRELVGEACYVSTPATNHGVLVVGSVEEVAKEIRDHFETPA